MIDTPGLRRLTRVCLILFPVGAGAEGSAVPAASLSPPPAKAESAVEAPIDDWQRRCLAEIEHQQERLEADPKNPDRHYQLASAYYKCNRFGKAVEFYRSAVELDPEDAESWVFLGLSYVNLGEEARGMEAMEKGLLQRPGDPTFAHARCNALAKLGRIDEAVVCADNAITLVPKRCEFHTMRADFIARRKKPGNGPMVVEAYRKAMEICPNHFDNYDRLGRYYFLNKKYQEAIDTYCEAFEHASDPSYRKEQLGFFEDISKLGRLNFPCVNPEEQKQFSPRATFEPRASRTNAGSRGKSGPETGLKEREKEKKREAAP